MSTRNDPTRTTLLRRSFESDLRKRFVAIARAVWALLVEQDVLGLESPRHGVIGLNAQEWRFLTSDLKLQKFAEWIQPLIDKQLLSTDGPKNQPWAGKYVESAYRKGVVRAYIDANGKELRKQSDFFKGSQAQFLKDAFSQPEMLSKVRLLATRTFEELKGVSAKMGTELNRALANGLVQGQNPRQIAREITKSINISKSRALTIARTEIVHAHAEGQLDGFEELGVDEVGILAEWSTAGDDRVCDQCAALEGSLMTIQEARGLIPRHPNCRCAWIPSTEAAKRNRLKNTVAKIAKSLAAQGGTLKKGREKSAWAGKQLERKLAQKNKQRKK